LEPRKRLVTVLDEGWFFRLTDLHFYKVLVLYTGVSIQAVGVRVQLYV